MAPLAKVEDPTGSAVFNVQLDIPSWDLSVINSFYASKATRGDKCACEIRVHAGDVVICTRGRRSDAGIS